MWYKNFTSGNKIFKSIEFARCWGLMPVILSTQRQNSGGWWFKASPRQIVPEDPILKKPITRAGRVTQVVRAPA
jgi:hypothetical protein